MLNRTLSLLCVASAVALLGAAPGESTWPIAERAELNDEKIVGEITGVEAGSKAFTLKKGERSVRILCTDGTVFFLDDVKSSFDKVVRVGNTVTVNHDSLMASRVYGKS